MSRRANNTRQQKPSFEEAYAQLEETVRALETGGVPLAEATRLFEEGMRLARICQEHLAATELKVTRLQRSYGAQMEMPGNGDAEPEPEPEDEEPGA
ncbi:MAG: exodeoxyribonuclease VII small subunit [Chloroflexi bacterium]|nr:exodeoxyribonuclease VII small subunit [Chloroflexota bacterium]